ncbi:MAG: hypothetical protein XD58_1462 [Thermotoga sp. 50_1627]|nr:MAG: hypothetical protein XD45_1535 [Thermotoga sp. 50_64]KUK24543.1 MAG: hypothetical protein XD58_1462 [Thermotoga sp. 50_1627]MDK2923587.1 hypothetical protein [Pseudothermotoga sp.]
MIPQRRGFDNCQRVIEHLHERGGRGRIKNAGRGADWLARLHGAQEVAGSSPVAPTRRRKPPFLFKAISLANTLDSCASRLTPYSTLLAKTFLSVMNQSPCLFAPLPAENLCRFFFQSFVHREEMFDLKKKMSRQIRQVLDIVETGIHCGHRKYLFIASPFVLHLQHSNGSNLNNASGKRWLIGHNENVQSISILSQSVQNEAIIGRIMQG